MEWAAAALLCAVAATIITLGHIYRHLLHYAEPIYQRFIVHIIFIVPVYSVMSFLSLILPDNAIYFHSIGEMFICKHLKIASDHSIVAASYV